MQWKRSILWQRATKNRDLLPSFIAFDFRTNSGSIRISFRRTRNGHKKKNTTHNKQTQCSESFESNKKILNRK